MYYITVSNGLLTPEHKKRMGIAVWEFMWCLDKVTKVDAKGDGWVLGGKPIKLQDIGMGHDNTVSRNLMKLEEAGYITTLRTPYGITVRVKKVKKRFNKTSESPKPVNHQKQESPLNNGESPLESGESNIDITVDITVDKTEGSSSKELGEFINLFKEVNPSYQKLFGMPPQRKASERMLKTHGFEKLEKIVALLPRSNLMEYMPVITTPCQLEDKMGQLAAGWQKVKNKAPLIL